MRLPNRRVGHGETSFGVVSALVFDNESGGAQGSDVVERVTRTTKIENISLNVLCENPLIYISRQLFSVMGDMIVGDTTIPTQIMLLDCGASMIYASRRWVEKDQFKTTKFQDKNIRVKRGDNQIIEAELEKLPVKIQVSGLDKAYDCVTVVYAIPNEFDCVMSRYTKFART
ncbi:unnamed protein product [Phytophthora fragariaefolia]|uniref:Unnamed protein product n=1 Tax=Phytophthora fragariaefolia TaxID=1490495 RepID=A0A9W7CZV9_9STRA|nr:unnamed protein product [Phytophthora fragariaefolia]